MKKLAQHTLKAPVHFSGVGLHSGSNVTMVLHPAPINTGVVFRRLDLPGRPSIAARWSNTIEAPLCTILSDGKLQASVVQIMTIEHLMAALSGCGIDNVLIDISGPEVPVMDGSAAPFVFMIDCIGRVAQQAPRRAIRVLRPVSVKQGKSSASLTPDDEFGVSCEIEFDNALIGYQAVDLAVDADNFKMTVSRARSFGFLHEVEAMRAAGRGLGGSLENVIIVDGETVLNEGGLRYTDEFVRHKALDIVGDLYLCGGPLLAHYHGIRPSHALTRRLLIALFADPTNWSSTTLPDVSAETVAESFWEEPARKAVYA